jgi:hypothetical protein
LPLKECGLEYRSRRVGVVFQQLGWPLCVVTQVEAAIKARLGSLPAGRDPVPITLRDAQQPQHAIITDDACDQFPAHLVELCRRAFQVPFNFFERECVAGAFVPVALSIERVEFEPNPRSGIAPIGPLVAGNALHRPLVSSLTKWRGQSSRSRRARWKVQSRLMALSRSM